MNGNAPVGYRGVGNGCTSARYLFFAAHSFHLAGEVP